MQLVTAKTPISRCETASIYTQESLQRFSRLFTVSDTERAKLNELAATLNASTASLLSAQADYRASVIALVGYRVGLKLVDFKADSVVRSAKRAADDAGADIAGAVFPNGTTPIVKPVGQSEVTELQRLEGRIAAASSWAAGAGQLALVTAVRGEYETAIRERGVASMAAGAKRAVRDNVREDFLDVFASVAAAIKQMFPRDRAKQDVFFESTRASAADDAEDPDDGDEPLTPAAG